MLSAYRPGPQQELRERKAEQEQAGTSRKKGCREGQAGSSCRAGPKAPKHREPTTKKTSSPPHDQRGAAISAADTMSSLRLSKFPAPVERPVLFRAVSDKASRSQPVGLAFALTVIVVTSSP